MTSPTLYIVAGPNGIGKTTSFFDAIATDIPIINSDEVAAEIRRKGNAPANTQELANAEAIRMMNGYLLARNHGYHRPVTRRYLRHDHVFNRSPTQDFPRKLDRSDVGGE